MVIFFKTAKETYQFRKRSLTIPLEPYLLQLANSYNLYPFHIDLFLQSSIKPITDKLNLSKCPLHAICIRKLIIKSFFERKLLSKKFYKIFLENKTIQKIKVLLEIIKSVLQLKC